MEGEKASKAEESHCVHLSQAHVPAMLHQSPSAVCKYFPGGKSLLAVSPCALNPAQAASSDSHWEDALPQETLQEQAAGCRGAVLDVLLWMCKRCSTQVTAPTQGSCRGPTGPPGALGQEFCAALHPSRAGAQPHSREGQLSKHKPGDVFLLWVEQGGISSNISA